MVTLSIQFSRLNVQTSKKSGPCSRQQIAISISTIVSNWPRFRCFPCVILAKPSQNSLADTLSYACTAYTRTPCMYSEGWICLNKKKGPYNNKLHVLINVNKFHY